VARRQINYRRKNIVTKVYATLLAMLVPLNCHAESYSKVSQIKNLTVSAGFARIELMDNTGDFEACSSERQWYYLDLSSTITGMKEMYAALLMAKTSGQQISLQLTGCAGTYSKITHVYVCDTQSCL
jgi:hypothetical protein